MNLPTREPGTIPESWPKSIIYYDHEAVKQEDGSLAAFTWNSGVKELGWVYDHNEDEAGFILCDDKLERLSDIFKWMLDGECDSDRKLVRNGRHYLAGEKDPEPLSAEESERRWRSFVFPVITNCLEEGSLIDQIVSVQPMQGPVGDRKWMDLVKSLLKPGEMLKEYAYGGVLSGRGGYYVVHESNPRRILRYRQTWLS
jgi:hypothetical protein